ncbi:MAG: hypothetical protein JWN92_371, partial [Candidatus Acidoferrum typicum]|nr:hypothetical protein [Candidatus Acidoferrum typicum]
MLSPSRHVTVRLATLKKVSHAIARLLESAVKLLQTLAFGRNSSGVR